MNKYHTIKGKPLQYPVSFRLPIPAYERAVEHARAQGKSLAGTLSELVQKSLADLPPGEGKEKRVDHAK